MFRLTVVLCALAAPLAAFGQAPTDTLSQCLADNTSGKDRKDLARWVFFAIAAHPEMKQYTSSETPAASDAAQKVMGATFTRLIAESCAKETKAALAAGGTNAIQVAFATFGQLAMQELMSNKEVAASMGRFEQHLDQAKIAQALGEK